MREPSKALVCKTYLHRMSSAFRAAVSKDDAATLAFATSGDKAIDVQVDVAKGTATWKQVWPGEDATSCSGTFKLAKDAAAELAKLEEKVLPRSHRAAGVVCTSEWECEVGHCRTEVTNAKGEGTCGGCNATSPCHAGGTCLPTGKCKYPPAPEAEQPSSSSPRSADKPKKTRGAICYGNQDCASGHCTRVPRTQRDECQ